MMTFFNILLAGFVGTAVMSLFPYLLSAFADKQFKQPVLLERFLNIENIGLPHRIKRVMTWLAHIGMGIILTFVYYYLCPHEYLDSLFSALVFGLLAAIFGIIVWIIILSIYNYKSKIDFRGFMIHLFFAHLIFAFGVVLTFKYLVNL